MNIQQFNFTVDLLQVILWQYNEAVRIQQLLTDKQNWYLENQTQFWEDWFENVFNLLTADQFGLVVWSIILDIPAFLDTNADPDKPTFGFNELPVLLNDNLNFNNGNFSSVGTTYRLTVEELRVVLRLRYYQLTSRGSIPDDNYFLSTVFPAAGTPFTGSVIVLDGFNMTLTYVFDFQLSRTMQTILRTFDLLPRPAGVRLRYVDTSFPIFGFGETPAINSNQNFDTGALFSDSPFH